MGYVCARLRARFARLLSAVTGEILRGLPSLAELFSALLPTDYGPSLKEWVLDVNDLGEWETALTATFARRVGHVRSLIEESVPAYAYLVDGEWDAHHLRVLLRRMAQGVEEAGAPNVGTEFVPLGTFTRDRYREALAARSPNDLCLRIQPWLPSWATALRSFLEPASDRAISLREIELRLDEEHFRRLSQCAPRICSPDDASIIRSYVALLADLTNLRTALRFLGRRRPREQVQSLYLRGGTLAEATFAALMATDRVEQICRLLSRGPLTAVLDQGRSALVNTGRASVFERPGDRQLLQLLHRLARRCPVSVAVPLHYLARSRNEWINLKMIACGIRYQLPTARVREGLVYV
jgi:vacuolar-type H+-ATPase subunit C/Vma6